MIRRTVRSLMQHFCAISAFVGMQKPWSFASSASAIRTSFGAGGSTTVHAHVMTARLTPATSSSAFEKTMPHPNLVVGKREQPAPADHDRGRQKIRTPEQPISNGPRTNTQEIGDLFDCIEVLCHHALPLHNDHDHDREPEERRRQRIPA